MPDHPLYTTSGLLAGSPANARYLWGASALLAGAAAGIVLFIFGYLLFRARRSARKAHLVRTFSMVISELAICDPSECAAVLQQPFLQSVLRRNARKPLGRSVLISELVKMNRSVSGTSAENIIWLYEELGLYRDSLSRLQARPWHVKARAIQELAEMKQDRCTAELLAATNHKNYFVRTEAKIALVRIIGFEGLRFLDIATYPITEWQQLCLLQELVHRHDFRWEQLQAWLRSPNETVVEFALRLIEVYQCFELHDSASVCLSSAAPLIQCQAVKTLGAVAWEDTPALLIERFPSLDVQAQRVALQVLQPLTSAASLPFFRSLEGHPDLLVRHRAARLAARLEQQATHRSDKSIPSAETV